MLTETSGGVQSLHITAALERQRAGFWAFPPLRPRLPPQPVPTRLFRAALLLLHAGSLDVYIGPCMAVMEQSTKKTGQTVCAGGSCRCLPQPCCAAAAQGWPLLKVPALGLNAPLDPMRQLHYCCI